MWAFIALIAIFIVVRFLWDLNKQNQKVGKEGGMTNKYKKLIGQILQLDNRNKIYQVTSDTVVLGLSSIGGSTIFTLTQTFGSVTIKWKVNSPVFGKHNLEWNFDEYADQDIMYAKMNHDVGEYTKNIMSAINYPSIE